MFIDSLLEYPALAIQYEWTLLSHCVAVLLSLSQAILEHILSIILAYS